MKTRLLKRLRREASKKYVIEKDSDGYAVGVYYGDNGRCRVWLSPGRIAYFRREYIIDKINELKTLK